MCMSVGHSNVGQNRYVSCNGMSVLGRCSIKFLGGLYVYVSFKLGCAVEVIGESVGKNIGDCVCEGFI